MSIAFVGSADLGNVLSGTSFTASYTCGSGSNRLLVVGFNGGNPPSEPDDILAVTYNAIPMSLAGKAVSNTTHDPRYSYVYYLLNPPSGANDVVITWSNSHFLAVLAADYTGVAQSSQPDGVTVHIDGTDLLPALTTNFTTIADGAWATLLMSSYGNNAAPAQGSGDTLRSYGVTFGEPGLFDSGSALTPPGNYSMTTSQPGSVEGISHIIVSFTPFGQQQIIAGIPGVLETAGAVRTGVGQRTIWWRTN